MLPLAVPNKAEDFVCLVCNDGDYRDDDLIVFCSGCNICVHQKCYGIAKVPDGDWFCEVCITFGPEGKFVRCPFCTRRGGAMRETSFGSHDKFWQTRNLSYYNFHEGVDPEQSQETFLDPNIANLIKDAHKDSIDKKSYTNPKNPYQDTVDFEENLFYDFYKVPKQFSIEDLQHEKIPRNSWCHLSCAFWIPEIFFADRGNGVKAIEGIDVIDKRRYGLVCSICTQKNGACIQCAKGKCQASFHVECARRSKMFMEVKNSENNGYTIYCEKHAPLKVKRTLESKIKTYVDDISKFGRAIEKFYLSYRYKFDTVPNYEHNTSILRQTKKIKKEPKEVKP
jgi:hypothetical protein